MLTPGTRIGPYELKAFLGAGGMGEVYRAHDARLRRDVAVKLLRDGLAASPDRVRRFEQEARAAGALNHPNILAVHDVGSVEGMPYVVSELLEGQTLGQRLRQERPPIDVAIEYAAQIVAGLAAAHEKGIVHRDIKPDNIFLTRDGRLKILDFGLAKLREGLDGQERDTTATAPGVVMGTVGYMSPEQVRGAPVDHRSDIFSLGAVVYEMLSGRAPFRRESAPETLAAILNEDPPRLASVRADVPAALDLVIRRCLEKRPDSRFHSAHDLGLAFEAVCTVSEPPRGTTPGAWWGPAGVQSRLAAVLWGTVALGLVGLGALVPGWFGSRLPVRATVASYRPLTFGRGIVTAARFVADGQTVAYSAAWEDKPSAVFTQRLDGLGASAQEVLPGRLLAVHGGEIAVLRPDGMLLRVSLTGGTPREVERDVVDAEWTASDQLAIVRFEAGRSRIEWPPGNVVRQTAFQGFIRSPRVSPDGSRLAFFETHAWTSGASVMLVDQRGQARALSGNWVEPSSLAFSADGQEIWFSGARQKTERDLRALDLDGRERVLTRGPGGREIHDVSRDGRALLSTTSQRDEAWGLLAGGDKPQDLTWSQNSYVTAISDDGRTTLFQHTGEFSGPAGASTYLRRVGDAGPIRLGEGQAMDLTRDGAWAVSVARDLRGEYKVYLLATGPGESRTLRLGTVVSVYAARFTPDGRRLVMSGHEEARPYRLFVQDLPDGLPKPISPEGLDDLFGFVVTPDGRSVAALSPGRQGQRAFVLYPIEGGNPRPIAGLKPDERPMCWSANGQFVFVQEISGTPGTWTVARIDTKTGVRQSWLKGELPDRVGVHGYVFLLITPDGRYWTASYRRELSNLYLVEGLE